MLGPRLNQGSKKGKKGKEITPILDGILVNFSYVCECEFSCIFWCLILGHFVAILCPKVPKWEVLGSHVHDI